MSFCAKKRILAAVLSIAVALTGQGFTTLSFSVENIVKNHEINKENTSNYYLEYLEEQYEYTEYTEYIGEYENQEEITENEQENDGSNENIKNNSFEQEEIENVNIAEDVEAENIENNEEPFEIEESEEDDEENLEEEYEEEPEEDIENNEEESEENSENEETNEKELELGEDSNINENTDEETTQIENDENNEDDESEEEISNTRESEIKKDLEENQEETSESKNENINATEENKESEASEEATDKLNDDNDEATESELDFEENNYEHTEEVTEHTDIDIDDISSPSDIEEVKDYEVASDSDITEEENEEIASESNAEEIVDIASKSFAIVLASGSDADNEEIASESNAKATESEADLATNSVADLATKSETNLATESEATASNSEIIKVATVAKADWKIVDIFLNDVSEGLAFQYESEEKIIDRRLATCADVKVVDENGDEMIINVPVTWVLKEEKRTAYKTTKERSVLTIDEFKNYIKISKYLQENEINDIDGFTNEEDIINYLKERYGEDIDIQIFSVASIAELEKKLNEKKNDVENEIKINEDEDDLILENNIQENIEKEILDSTNSNADLIEEKDFSVKTFTENNNKNNISSDSEIKENETIEEEYESTEPTVESTEEQIEEVPEENIETESIEEVNEDINYEEEPGEIKEIYFDEFGNVIISSENEITYIEDNNIHANGEVKSGVIESFEFDIMNTNYEPKMLYVYELDLEKLKKSVAEILSNKAETVKAEEERQEKIKNGESLNLLGGEETEDKIDKTEEKEDEIEETLNPITSLFKSLMTLTSIKNDGEENDEDSLDENLIQEEEKESESVEENIATKESPKKKITNTDKTIAMVSFGNGMKNKQSSMIVLGAAGTTHGTTADPGHGVCGNINCTSITHKYDVYDTPVSIGGRHKTANELFEGIPASGVPAVFTASTTHKAEALPLMAVKKIDEEPIIIDQSHFYYLSGKVDFRAKWLIKEGVTVVICLNGCPFEFYNQGQPASSSYIKGSGTVIFTNCQTGANNESYISKTIAPDADTELFNTPVQTHNFGLYGLKTGNTNNIKVKDLYLGNGKGKYGDTIYTAGTIENGRGAALFGTYNWDTVAKEGSEGNTVEKKQVVAGSTVMISNIDFDNLISTRGNAAIQVFAPGSYQDEARKEGADTDDMAEKNFVNGTYGTKKQSDIGCFLGVENCNFEKCQSSGYGGALFVGNGEVQIINNKFNNCTSELDGGAVYISGGRNKPSYFKDCSFTNNKAKFNGAAIGVKNLMGLDITHSTFENNKAEGSGGALAYYESNYVDQYVYYNKIPGTIKQNQDVARIIEHDPFVHIATVTFINNSANISGGAVHISDNTGCPQYPADVMRVNEVTKTDYTGREYIDDTDIIRYNKTWVAANCLDSGYSYNANKKLKVDIESSNFNENKATNLSAFGGALHITGNIDFNLGGENIDKKVTLKDNKAQAGAGLFTQGYEPWHYRRIATTTKTFKWTGHGTDDYFMNPFRLDYKIPIKYNPSLENPNGIKTEAPQYDINLESENRKVFYHKVGSYIQVIEDLSLNNNIPRDALINIKNVDFDGGSTYFSNDDQLTAIAHELYEKNQLEKVQQAKRIASYNELNPSYDMFFDMSNEIARKATYTEAFYTNMALKEVKDGATAGAMYLGHRASVSVAETGFKNNISGVLYVDGADVTLNKTDIIGNKSYTYGGIIEYCRFNKNNIKLVSVIATNNTVGDLREQYDPETIVNRDIEKSELLFSGECQILQNYLASASLPGGIDRSEERDVLVDIGSLNLSWDRGFVPNGSVGVYAHNLDEALVTDRWERTNENIPDFGRGVTVNDYFYIDQTHLNTDNNFSIYRDNNYVYLGKYGTKVRFIVDIPGSEHEFKAQYIKYNTAGTVIDPPFDPTDFSKSKISNHNTFCGFVGNDYNADCADPSKKHVVTWDFDNDIVVGTTTTADDKYRTLRAVYTNDDIHMKACGGKNTNTWILEEVVVATVNVSTLPNARKVRINGVDKYEIIEYNEIKTSTDSTAVCYHAGYDEETHRDRGIAKANTFAARYLNYIAVSTFSDLFYTYNSTTEKYNTQYVLMNDIIFTDKDNQLDNEKLIYMNGHNIILQTDRPLFKLTNDSAASVKKAVDDGNLPVGGVVGLSEKDIASGSEYPKIIFKGSSKHINHSLIEQSGNNNLMIRSIDLTGVTIDDSVRLVKHDNISDTNYAGTKTSLENVSLIYSTFSTLLEGQVFNLSQVKVADSHIKNMLFDSKAFGSSLKDVDINNNYFGGRIFKIKSAEDTSTLKQKATIISSVSIMHNIISTKTSGQGYGMLSISNTSVNAPEADFVVKENFVIATNYNTIKQTPAAGNNDHRIIHFELTENTAQMKIAENANLIVRDNVVDYQGNAIPNGQHLEYVYFDYGDGATDIKHVEVEGNIYIEENTYTGNDKLAATEKPTLTGVRLSKFAVLRTYASILRIRKFYNTYEDINADPNDPTSTTDPYYGSRRVIPFFLEPKYVPGYTPSLDADGMPINVVDDTTHQLQFIEQMPGKKFKASDSVLEAWADLKVQGTGVSATIKCHEIRVFKGWFFDNIEGFNNKKLNVSRFVAREIIQPDSTHICADDTRRAYKQEIGNDCYVMFGINFVNVFFVPFNTIYNRYITTPTEIEKEEFSAEYDIDYDDPYRQYFSFMKMQRVANGYGTTLEPVDEVKSDGTVVKYVWKYPYTVGGVAQTRFKTFPLDMATASVQASGRDIYVYGRPAEEHTHKVYVGDRMVHYKDEIVNVNPNIATHDNVPYDKVPREILESGNYEAYVNPTTHLYVYKYYGPATITTITYKEGERHEDYKEYLFWSPAYDDDENNFNLGSSYSPIGRPGDASHPLVKQGYRTMDKTEDIISAFDYENAHIVLKDDITVRSELITAPENDFAICLDGHNLTIELEEHPNGLGGDINPTKWFETNIKSGKVIITNCKDTGTITIKNHASTLANDGYRMQFTNEGNLFLSSVSIVTEGINPMQPFAHFDNSNFALSNVSFEDNVTYNNPIFKSENALQKTCDDLNAGPYAKFEHVKIKDYTIENTDPIIDVSNARSIVINDVNIDNMVFSNSGSKFMKFNTMPGISTASIAIKNSTIENNIVNDDSYIYSVDTNNLVLDHTLFKGNTYKTSLIEKNSTKGIDFENVTYDDNKADYIIDLEGYEKVEGYRLSLINNRTNASMGPLSERALIHVKDFTNASTQSNIDEVLIDNNRVSAIFVLEGDIEGLRIKNGKIINNTVLGNGSYGGGIINFKGSAGHVQNITFEGSKRIVASTSKPEGATKSVTEYVVDETSIPTLEISNNKLTTISGVIHASGSESENILYIAGDVRISDNKHYLDDTKQINILTSDKYIISHKEEDEKISGKAKIYLTPNDIEIPIFKYWTDKHIASINTPLYYPAEKLFVIDNPNYKGGEEDEENPGQYMPFIYKKGTSSNVELWFGKDYEQLIYINTFENESAKRLIAKQFVACNVDTLVDKVIKDDVPLVYQTWAGPKDKGQPGEIIWRPYLNQNEVRLSTTSYVNLTLHGHEDPSTHEIIYYRGALDINDLYTSSESNIFIAGDAGLNINDLVDFDKFNGKTLRICLLGRDLIINQNKNIFDIKEGCTLDISDCLVNNGKMGRVTTRDASITPPTDKKVFINANGGKIKLNQIKIASINIVDNTRIIDTATTSDIEIDNFYIEGIHSTGDNEAINIEKTKINKIENLHIINNNLSYPALKIKDLETVGHKFGLKNFDVNDNIVEKGAVEFTGLDIDIPNTGTFNINNNISNDIAPVVFKNSKIKDEAITSANDNNGINGAVFYLDNSNITFGIKKAVFTNNSSDYGTAIYQKESTHDTKNMEFYNNVSKKDGIVYFENPENINFHDAKFVGSTATESSIIYVKAGTNSVITIDNNNIDGTGGGTVGAIIKVDANTSTTNLNANINIKRTTIKKTTLKSIYKIYNVNNSTFETGTLTFDPSNAFTNDSKGYLYANNAEFKLGSFPTYTNKNTYAPYITVENNSHLTYSGDLVITGNTLEATRSHIINVNDAKFSYTGTKLTVTGNKTALGPIGVSGNGIFYIHDLVTIKGNTAYYNTDKAYDVYLEDNGKLAGEAMKKGTTLDSLGRYVNLSTIAKDSIINFYRDVTSSGDGPVYEGWDWYYVKGYNRALSLSDPFYFPEHFVTMHASLSEAGYKVYKRGTGSETEIWIGNDYKELIYKAGSAIIATQYVANNVSTKVDFVYAQPDDIDVQIWMGPSEVDETVPVEWYYLDEGNNTRITDRREVTLYTHEHQLCGCISTWSCPHGTEYHKNFVFAAMPSVERINNSMRSYLALVSDFTLTSKLQLKTNNTVLCLNGHTLTFRRGANILNLDGKSLTITDCQNKTGKLAVYDDGNASTDQNIFAKKSKIKFINTRIASVNTSDKGEMIRMYETGTKLELIDTIIEDVNNGNEALLSISNGEIIIKDVTVRNNNSSSLVSYIINAKSDKVNISTLNIVNNTNGRHLFNFDTVNLQNFHNINIVNNTLDSGSIFNFKNSGTINMNEPINIDGNTTGTAFYTINNTTMNVNKGINVQNTVGKKGTIFYIDGNGKVNLATNNIVLNNNKAEQGGFAYVKSGTLCFKTDYTLTGFKADKGSVLYLGSNGYLEVDEGKTLQITGNSAVTPGALPGDIYIEGGALKNKGQINIYDDILVNPGIGLIYDGSNAYNTLQNIKIKKALALDIKNHENLIIKNATISECGGVLGSALTIEDAKITLSDKVDITNNENAIHVDGGELIIDSPTVNISSNTGDSVIMSNTKNGGIIRFYNGTITNNNNIKYVYSMSGNPVEQGDKKINIYFGGSMKVKDNGSIATMLGTPKGSIFIQDDQKEIVNGDSSKKITADFNMDVLVRNRDTKILARSNSGILQPGVKIASMFNAHQESADIERPSANYAVYEYEGDTYIGYPKVKLTIMANESGASFYDEELTGETVTHKRKTFEKYRKVNEATKKEKGVTYGMKIGDIPIPKKEGYTFEKYTIAGSTSEINKDTIFDWTAEPETIYAHFKPNNYTIVFDSNYSYSDADTGVTGVMTPMIATYGEELILPDNNYHLKIDTVEYGFLGWKLESYYNDAYSQQKIIADKIYQPTNKVKNLTASPNETIVFKAVWDAPTYNMYVVNNNLRDYIQFKEGEKREIYYKDTIGDRLENIDYTSDLYEPHLHGWAWTEADRPYTEAEIAANPGLVIQPTEQYSYSTDSPIYPMINLVYTKFRYQNADGGPWTSEENQGMSVKARINEVDGGVLHKPTRTGWEFLGWEGPHVTWAASANEVITFTVLSTDSLLYTAHWRRSPVTITLNANNGEFLIDDTIITKYTTDTIRFTEICEREGYKLTGFGTKRNSGGTDYPLNTDILVSDIINTGTITLYAKWQKKGINEHPEPDPDPYIHHGGGGGGAGAGIMVGMPVSDTHLWIINPITGQWHAYDAVTGQEAVGWKPISYAGRTAMYYFEPNGDMHTGWLFANKNYYYFQPDGCMAGDGLFEIDGVVYTFGPDGECIGEGDLMNTRTNFIPKNGVWEKGMDNIWHYLILGDQKDFRRGDYYKGIGKIGNYWYYFDKEGKMVTGLQEMNGKLYYFNVEEGEMLGALISGFVEINGELYYFDASEGGALTMKVPEYAAEGALIFRYKGSTIGEEIEASQYLTY